jgi:hypothetical protein
LDTHRYTRKHLNPGDLPSPVHLERFSRRNLSKWFRILGYKTGAEIGVAEGRHSKQMCEQNPGVQLLCVDTWEKYSGNRRGGPQSQHDRNYKIAKRILRPFSCQIVKAFSMDAVREVPPESLDFVYIDGNHAFDYVMQDIIEWGKRVRRGGIISGHDYYHFRGAGVVEAVDVYTHIHGVRGWFLTNEAKEKSWFFVKTWGAKRNV